jgi:hypothetical protein
MSIINGLNKPYTGHVVLRKGIKWLCLKITICRTTIEESILPQIMKLESDIYLQNNGDKKERLSMPYPKLWNYSARLKGTFNVEGLITSYNCIR